MAVAVLEFSAQYNRAQLSSRRRSARLNSTDPDKQLVTCRNEVGVPFNRKELPYKRQRTPWNYSLSSRFQPIKQWVTCRNELGVPCIRKEIALRKAGDTLELFPDRAPDSKRSNIGYPVKIRLVYPSSGRNCLMKGRVYTLKLFPELAIPSGQTMVTSRNELGASERNCLTKGKVHLGTIPSAPNSKRF